MRERSEKARYWPRQSKQGATSRWRMTAGGPPRCQHGVALVVMLAILLLVSAAMILDHMNSRASGSAGRDIATAMALGEAKAALMAWSVTYLAGTQRQTGPGTLPYPDRSIDGNYDGTADCDLLGVGELVRVGRLP